MRLIQFVPGALMLCLAVPALAQEWTEYVNREDRFTVNFPGQPQVREITWPSEYGMVFSGRVYTARRGAEQYSVTVIDYSDAEKKYLSMPRPPSFQQAVYWQIDIMASIQYAATKLYRQRPGAKVTYDAWHYIDLVEGHQLHVTNADQTITHASIYLHENRLYILDGTVPPNAAEPGLFTQSLGFLDAEGKGVRYSQIYSNRLPPVTMGGRGGRGRGQGAGQGQGQGQ
ncbi:MAG: hypothetical protein ACREMQ_18715 [Longimicrobiales bacterium]